MLSIIFFILGVIALFGSLLFTCLFFYLFLTNKTVQQPLGHLTVAVIVPCKGIGVNLEENLRGICEQEYPGYHVLFVVDSTQDPAYPVLQRIVHITKNTCIELSEKIPTASGKIAALIAGIKKAGVVDVYVFADSDIRPHKRWLTNLVAGLSEKNIGAATGFRWFFPHNLKTSLISAWNMASMTSLFLPQSNWAWGGSTAIRKNLFEQLHIEARWKNGFSDDLILTDAVKKAGYRIKFVPSCLVESPAETDITKFLHWGTSQFTWVRWYNPVIWFCSLCGMILLQMFIILGCILLITGYTLPGLLLISPILSEMIFGFVGFLTLRRFMCYPKEQFGSITPYVVLMPFVCILFTYNLLLSGVTQEIKWCGKSYRKKDALKNIQR
jgi:cellulose synthase/poly-beta-1,6-N-acetylglucosamine synthase-like glycosyltransferase